MPACSRTPRSRTCPPWWRSAGTAPASPRSPPGSPTSTATRWPCAPGPVVLSADGVHVAYAPALSGEASLHAAAGTATLQVDGSGDGHVARHVHGACDTAYPGGVADPGRRGHARALRDLPEGRLHDLRRQRRGARWPGPRGPPARRRAAEGADGGRAHGGVRGGRAGRRRRMGRRAPIAADRASVARSGLRSCPVRLASPGRAPPTRRRSRRPAPARLGSGSTTSPARTPSGGCSAAAAGRAGRARGGPPRRPRGSSRALPGTPGRVGAAVDERTDPALQHGDDVLAGQGLVRLERVREREHLQPVLLQQVLGAVQQPVEVLLDPLPEGTTRGLVALRRQRQAEPDPPRGASARARRRRCRGSAARAGRTGRSPCPSGSPSGRRSSSPWSGRPTRRRSCRRRRNAARRPATRG